MNILKSGENQEGEVNTMDGLNIAAGSIRTADTSLSVTSNNIANINTSGFRSDNTQFQTGPGGRGVEVASVTETNRPGPVVLTGGRLDLSLPGDSFFAVRRSSGELAFTRDGSFQIDAAGRITTPNGDLLDPQITVPAGARQISVGRDGTVTGLAEDGTETALGRIEPVRFPNPQGLENIGGNLFRPTAASGAGTRETGPEVLQGALTLSNTDLATEMVNLIRDERFTQANAAVVRTEDENLGTILDTKR